jgi:RimJ/RimL family protein N-acetyltransferase
MDTGMSRPPTLRRAQAEDAPFFFQHLQRHFAESGNEDVIFHPNPNFKAWDADEYIESLQEKWSKSPEGLGWEVVWLAEVDGEIRGHVDLKAFGIATARHRTILGMGLEKPIRGAGVGSRLMQTALDWATAQPHLEWVDLYVFSDNLPAVRLYEKFGFVKIGEVSDMFRIHGVSIRDIHMCRRLK